MATVLMDLLKGSGSKEINGYRFTRIATVRGLTGTASERIKNAIDEVENYLGSGGGLGTSYPGVDGCILRSISIGTQDDVDVNVVLEYSTESFDSPDRDKLFKTTPMFAFTSGLSQLEKPAKDDGGDNIQLAFPQYVGPGSENADTYGYNTTALNYVTPTLSIDESEKHLVVTIKQVGSDLSSVNSLWNTYGNKLNSVDWAESGDSGLWKFVSMRADPYQNESGTGYDVTFQFVYRESGWNDTVFYRKDSGDPPGDDEITRYSGISGVKVTEQSYNYDTADFNNLFSLS